MADSKLLYDIFMFFGLFFSLEYDHKVFYMCVCVRSSRNEICFVTDKSGLVVGFCYDTIL